MDSGICDRLRQITFCIALDNMNKKKFNKKKKILIYEKLSEECPYYFSDLFQIKNYSIHNIKKRKIGGFIKMTPFDSMINFETCKKFNNKRTIDNMKLLEKWKKTYKLLKPKKNSELEISQIIKKKNFCSIHIRLTDKVVSFKEYMFEIPNKDVIMKFQLDSFYKNILKIIDKRFQYIYVSSDENIFKKKIEKKLKNNGYKIIKRVIKYNQKKLRQTSGKDFIKDLFILSRSKEIIASTGGNVPSTAILISKNKIKYLKWTNYKILYIMLNSLRALIFFIRGIT